LNEARNSVAVLGGAFDPVTDGHIAAAKYVLDACGIFDEVWLMPCLCHMYAKRMEAPHHRLRMCEIAAESVGGVVVSPYEIDRGLGGKTSELVRRLLAEDFPGARYDFSFVIGMDNANSFGRWASHKDLERAARFVVVPRPGIEPGGKFRWYESPPHILVPSSDRLIQTSSTLVRSMLRKGQHDMAAEHLHPGVLDYIKEHGLYGRIEGP